MVVGGFFLAGTQEYLSRHDGGWRLEVCGSSSAFGTVSDDKTIGGTGSSFLSEGLISLPGMLQVISKGTTFLVGGLNNIGVSARLINDKELISTLFNVEQYE